MRAWQFTKLGEPLHVAAVPPPMPSGGEVVVHVRAAGVCHSDVGFITGPLTDLLEFTPITLGHEIAGTVSAIGPGVDTVAIGDRVAVRADPSGPGMASDGGFASEVLVREDLTVPIPFGLDWAQAATATDAGLTAYHAMVTQGQVTAGERVGVLGFGGLGVLGAQIALAAGAEVFVCDVNPHTHDVARQLGVTGVATDISAFRANELDLIVDFAGFGTTTAQAIQTIRRGGRVVVVGLGRPEAEIDWLTVIANEAHVIGSSVGQREDLVEVLDLMASGALTSRVSEIGFDEIGSGLARLERGEVIGRLVALFG